MTAVRSLRIGDQIVAQSQPDETEQEIATVTGFEDLEDARQIRVAVDFADGSKGAMEFAPARKVRRVVAVGDEDPGGIVMVFGDALWKWVGTSMNDPNGGTEKFLIAGFKRPEPPDGTIWIGLRSYTSDRMFNAQIKTDHRILFEDEER